jgi:hypothetical protein
MRIKLLISRQTFVCYFSIHTNSYTIWSIINDAQVPQLPTFLGLIALLIQFFPSIVGLDVSSDFGIFCCLEQTKTNEKNERSCNYSFEWLNISN